MKHIYFSSHAGISGGKEKAMDTVEIRRTTDPHGFVGEHYVLLIDGDIYCTEDSFERAMQAMRGAVPRREYGK